MSDILLNCLNEARAAKGFGALSRMTIASNADIYDAFVYAAKSHEAFRQEVSDKCQKIVDHYICTPEVAAILRSLVIPAPKPDPLVEVFDEMKDGRAGLTSASHAAFLRAELEARGLKIVEASHDGR